MLFSLSHFKKISTHVGYISTYPSSSDLISLIPFIGKIPQRVVFTLCLHIFSHSPRSLLAQASLANTSPKPLFHGHPARSNSWWASSHWTQSITSSLLCHQKPILAVLFLPHRTSFLVSLAESSISPNYSLSEWPQPLDLSFICTCSFMWFHPVLWF